MQRYEIFQKQPNVSRNIFKKIFIHPKNKEKMKEPVTGEMLLQRSDREEKQTDIQLREGYEATRRRGNQKDIRQRKK